MKSFLSTIAGHRNLANYIGWATLVISAVVQFVFAPVVRDIVGENGLGVWFLIFQTFAYLQLVDIGISNAIVRTYAFAGSSERETADIVATAKRIFVWIGGGFFTFGLFASVAIPYFVTIENSLKNDFTFSVLCLACWGMFRYYLDLPRLVLRGQDRIVEYNILVLIESVGRPIAGIVLLFMTSKLSGIVAGYVLIEFVVRLIASRLTGLKSEGEFSKEYFRKLIRFGSGVTAIRVSSLILFYSSAFLIGWKIDTKSIAIYQCTVALPFFLFRFFIVPFTNYLPRFVKMYGMQGGEAVVKAGTKSHLQICLFSILAYSVVTLTNAVFVKIWVGQELFGGTLFSAVYSLFCVLTIARHNGYMLWQSFGSLKPMAVAHLVEIPSNIIISIIMLPKIGIIAIPIAFVVSHLPVFIVAQLPFFISHGNLLKNIKK